VAESNTYVATLQRERAKLLADRERIDGQIAGLDFALRHFNVVTEPTNNATQAVSLQPRPPREGSIKDYAFTLVAEFNEGLSSAELLAEAEKRGRPLNRNTITSLLSASASQGLLEFANGRYRIPKGVPEAETAPGPSDNLV
jgi:hypothetical protein